MSFIINQVRNKPAWGIALVLSIIYFILFLQVSNGKIETGLLFGFCVWGTPGMPSEEMPNLGCVNAPHNSHVLAFGIDFSMTAAAGLFWYLDKNKRRSDTLIYAALGFIILAHGLLHWFLQQKENPFGLPVIDCFDPEIGSGIERLGYIIFGAFSCVLSLIILGFGFGLNIATVGGSALFTAAVVFLTKGTGGDLLLPGLFCVVHPLSCFTGLFSNEPEFNQTVGVLFILCTLVGISELSACVGFLRGYGGHIWYDLTLHLAILAALPYFTSRATRVKKD